MHKINVAVCDSDNVYRERFVAYMMEHEAEAIQIHAFSEREAFLHCAGERSFDVILLGTGFYDMEEEAAKYSPRCLCLSDSMPKRVAEADNYCAGESPVCEKIFRYQSMDAIVHILKVAGGVHRATEVSTGTRMEVIGVCSPIRHEMQIPFSVVLAGYLAERYKVLYLNLMEYAGFLELFHQQAGYDLEDIVLRIRNRRLAPEIFLKCIYEMGRISYVPPFRNPENVHSFTSEEYGNLLDFLNEKTDFEVAVVDFGVGIGNLAGLLEQCSHAYCLTKQGFFYACQTNHFMEYIKAETAEPFLERFHMVTLPFSARHIHGGEDVQKQLEWSEFGDFVRAYLAGDKE